VIAAVRSSSPPTVSIATYVQCPVPGGTKLLHDLFPPVIASVSTCGVHGSSYTPAGPDAASGVSHITLSVLRLYPCPQE